MKLKYKGKELVLAVELVPAFIDPNVKLSTTYNEEIYEGEGYSWNDAFRDLVSNLDLYCKV